MKSFFGNFITSLCMFFAAVYIRIIVCFVRAFLWAVPIMLVWNKIIVGLATVNPMTYWNAYWICIVVMALLSANAAINIKKS